MNSFKSCEFKRQAVEGMNLNYVIGIQMQCGLGLLTGLECEGFFFAQSGVRWYTTITRLKQRKISKEKRIGVKNAYFVTKN